MNSFVKFLIFAFVFLIGVGVGISIIPIISGTDTIVQETPVPTETIPSTLVPETEQKTAAQTQTTVSETAAPSQTSSNTVTPSETPGSTTATVTSTSTPTPAKAASPNDPILGTWTGSKSVLFVYSGGGTITFKQDFTAAASGNVKGPGVNEQFSVDDLRWENLGNGNYLGTYGGKILEFALVGEKLTVTINPKSIGLTDAIDMDITVELTKVA